MFEWGGGTIWCNNNAAREKYGVGAIEEKLPLSKQTLDKLENLTKLHDTALNWDYPPAPSPWSKERFKSFENKALKILEKLRDELGDKYDIQYHALGEPNM